MVVTITNKDKNIPGFHYFVSHIDSSSSTSVVVAMVASFNEYFRRWSNPVFVGD
ncbi:MAG: hypothetical protein JO297_15895 [Nitrososphaeraceae archaeon]|nr:hypothetical protein [Nitrososphaeraceae archaeon]